jgi:hypothetical protein
VIIPVGTWDFGEATVSIPGGVDIAGDADPPTGTGNGTIRTVLVLPPNGTTDRTMFSVNGQNGKPVTVSGIYFLGRTATDSPTGDTGIYFNNVTDFRVYNCRFELMGYHGVHDWGILTCGVVYHCGFINNYKAAALSASRGWGYGVALDKNYYISDGVYEPDITKILGQYSSSSDPAVNGVFIEDCYFAGNRHAVAANTNVHYVFRYNVVYYPTFSIPYDFHQCDAHGATNGAGSLGTRCIEVYNNTFYNTAGHGAATGIHWRGGGGVAFNNTFVDNYDAAVYLCNEQTPPVNNQSRTTDIWIWGNTIPSGTNLVTVYPSPDDSGWIVLGQDYWLVPPWTTGQNFTAFNYTPYPYPHPLTLS